MAKYTVITPVRRNGKRVLSGGTIELSDSAASSLLILGAIKADSMAEAAAQADAEAAAKVQADTEAAAKAQADTEAAAKAQADAEAVAKAQAEAAAKNSKTKGEKLL